jgi:alpha-D-ribose 1-methylphosphonate 5-triphosphate synthase subunit PhnG
MERHFMPRASKPTPQGAETPASGSDRDDARGPLAAERRAELLAVAEVSDLVALAERCLDGAAGTVVVEPPTIGTIPLCVREPVVGERFILADVLATQAEVVHRGQRGWAMRLGDDATATLAAAVCDAEAASGAGLAAEVELLCRRTEQRRADEAAREWAELARTEVHFRELA